MPPKSAKAAAPAARAERSSQGQTQNPSQASTSRLTKGRYTQAEVEKRIRERAFLLFERRGQAHGNDRQDWIEAEKQIKKELGI